MPLSLKLAWRNVRRNMRRTVLCGLAVGIGLASLIFMDALFEGMIHNMIRNATHTFLGEGQIHMKGFMDTMETELVINSPDEIMRGLSAEPAIKSFTPRTATFGMLSSAANMSSVGLYGIRPETESGISMIDEAVTEGAYLGKDDRGHIMIGYRLAETLEVGLGDRVVATVAQAGTAELSQEMFRVGGIFRFNVREVDSAMAFIHIDKARAMLSLPGGTHEIAMIFKDINQAGDRANPIWSKYSKDGNEALSWRDLVPQLDGVLELSGMSTAIIMTLIFSVVALTVMNTLFMSLYERIYEFGVLRAIGTRPTGMAGVVLMEAACLALISVAIGICIALAFIIYFGEHGIDYTGIEFAGVTLTEPIYPVMRTVQFTVIPLLVFCFAIVAAIYPAFFAARLKPSEAIRRSL